MNKEKSLYGIIGVLAGLIIGYIGANYINSNAPVPRSDNAAGASSLPPDHPPAASASGSSSGAQGDVMAVIEQARNEPSNFDAQMKAVDMFLQINRKDGALEFYERAARIKPNDFDLLARLGDAYFDLQRFDDAAKWYEQALKIKSDSATARKLTEAKQRRNP